MKPIVRCLLILVSTVPALRAQQATWKPSTELPNGREVVAVYLSANSCGPCHSPVLKSAVREMKAPLAVQARKAGASFSVIGVANDWDHALAAPMLTDTGPYDQVVIGGNWTNIAIEHLVWNDPQGRPVMPQVVVFERTVTLGSTIRFSEPRMLRRLVGPDSISAWVTKGASIALK